MTTHRATEVVGSVAGGGVEEMLRSMRRTDETRNLQRGSASRSEFPFEYAVDTVSFLRRYFLFYRKQRNMSEDEAYRAICTDVYDDEVSTSVFFEHDVV